MVPSNSESSNFKNNRYSQLAPLNLPSTFDSSTKSLPVTPIATQISPRSFTSNGSSASISPDQIFFVGSNAFPLPKQLTPNGDGSSSLKREDINENLIDFSVEIELSTLDPFDPFKQSNQSPVLPSKLDNVIPNTPDVVIQNTNTPVSPVASTVSSSLPYPIKLRLKLAACSELKPISQFVQQIRNERQSQQ
ncbi:unnamed protein product, partial [Rotaria sp. Silwood1]